jgi:hypothetical protein
MKLKRNIVRLIEYFPWLNKLVHNIKHTHIFIMMRFLTVYVYYATKNMQFSHPQTAAISSKRCV